MSEEQKLEVPAEAPIESDTEIETPKNESDDLELKVQAAQTEAEKWKQTAENYRKENEKYRRNDRDLLETPTAPQEEAGLSAMVRNDFASKRQDVLDELHEEINELPNESWSKIKSLVNPAVQQILEKAIQEKRYVARGEIKRAVNDLVSYAKGLIGKEEEIERAKAEGAREMQKAEMAEIKGVKNTPRPTSPDVIEEDRKRAEETGRTPEAERDMRQRREARKTEYAPPVDPVSRYQ